MRRVRSRQRSIRALTLVLAGGMAVVAASTADATSAAGGSLLPAGEFEADADGDGLANGWHFSGDEGVQVRFAIEPGQYGPCQRIECTSFRRLSSSSHVLIWTPVLRLEAGHTYQLTFYVRGQGLTETPVNVSILDTEPVWTPIGLLRTVVPNAYWRRYSFRFEASKSASENTRLQVWFLGTGTLWLDEVSLLELEPQPPRFTETVPPAGGKNLVPNSSFELGTVGWGSFAPFPAWGGNLNRLFGEHDTSTAAVHFSSLRITASMDTLPVHFSAFWDQGKLIQWAVVKQPLAANRGWIAVQPGLPYTLSAYLKADRPGVVARLQVRETEWTAHETTVEVGRRWRRYSLTCRPDRPQVFVCIGPDLAAANLSEATLWIDGVQLEAGEEATLYEPRAEVEVGLRPKHGSSIFWVGHPPVGGGDCAPLFESVAFNASKVPRNVIFGFEIDGIHGTGSGWKDEEQIWGWTTRSFDVDVDVSKRNFYRIALEAEGGAVVCTRPWRAALIDRYAEDDSLFGINHAPPCPELLNLLREIGVLWVRDWSLKWETVASEPGRFDFTETDAVTDAVARHGVRILGLLPYPSSNWSSSAPADVEPTPGPGFDRRMVYMPRCLDDFARYVQATVEHYRGRIQAWEILNEPLYCRGGVLSTDLGYSVDDYVRLLRIAYETIKAVDSSALVVGGIGGGPELYTREFIEAGGLAYVDALNLHIYPELAAPEIYIAALEELVARMREDGRERPLWVTECGYYADDAPPVEPVPSSYPAPLSDEWEAATCQARLNLVLLGLGARKIFYHCGACGSINNEALYGPFFEYEAQPRKVLAVQAAMAHLLGPDTQPLGRVPTPKGVYAWAFYSRGRTVIAAWAPDRNALIEHFPSGTRLLDILGNELPVEPSSLEPDPLYVVLPGRARLSDLSGMFVGLPER